MTLQHAVASELSNQERMGAFPGIGALYSVDQPGA